MRFHDFGHGVAARLISQEVDIKSISDLLGHSTTRMTLDVYSHIIDFMRSRAADKMDKLLEVHVS